MSRKFSETQLYDSLKGFDPGVSVLGDLFWPTMRDEEWKYTDLAPLAENRFMLKKARARGVAGFSGDDLFDAFNETYAPEPIVIRVPRHSSSDAIIRIPGSLEKDLTGCVILPRVLIHLEQGAQASVMASHVVSAGEYLYLPCMDIVLEEGARLELLRSISPGLEAFSISSLRVRQAGNSSLRSFFFTQGARSLRDNVKVVLQGEGAEAFLNGLHHLEMSAHADSHTCIDHVAPHTTSDQLYKSILRGKAQSVFNGKIMVRREAQQTNSYQLNKNLLLSQDARVNTKPQLEIFADDVKCSHGAAIGQLDDDQLFYLQTRGIEKAAAKEMLVQGFIEDVLSKISHPQLRAAVGATLSGDRSQA